MPNLSNSAAGPSDTLADAFLSQIPRSRDDAFRSILTSHSTIVRTSFLHLSRDPEAKLLATATALISARHADPLVRARLQETFHSWVRHVRRKKDNVITGKLAGVAFTLFLLDALDPRASTWREQLHFKVERSIERGGAAWLLGAGPPLPGYRGGELVNQQPVAFALYLALTAMLEIFAQAKLSPGIPDPIEVMFGVPRCIVPAFARVVALVSRRSQSAVDGAGLQEEELDFEASVLRLELESAWPARLQGRRDSRRVQYGAQLLRLSLLTLLLQKVQLYPASSPDVVKAVDGFYELCQEAKRQDFEKLLPLAKNPVGGRDMSEVAQEVCHQVHAGGRG
ncbi:hypothetical protein JCM24511_09303 [Saitozyma sp. JCM 24511]|nr:hypothetical protein JCM24511_09303 [Saitozyma sp. JCM 24511]